MSRRLAWALVLPGLGCGSAAPSELPPDVVGLVNAAPGDWADAALPVLQRGDSAAPELAAAIRANRGAPGEQCAIAVLGALDVQDPDLPLLVEILHEGGQSGAEAALALGRTSARSAIPDLRTVVADPSVDTLTRTSAAAARFDLGDDSAAAFLAAILVAGTPHGVESSARFGLPDRPRWALERVIAIEAIARRFDGERFGLDPDLAWSELEAGRARFVEAVRSEDR